MAPRFSSLFPAFHGACETTDGDILVAMENVMSAGYAAVGVRQFHTLAQVRTSLRSLGVFHAVSYAMKVLDGVDWTGMMTHPHDYIHSEEQEEAFAPFHLGANEHYLRILQVQYWDSLK